MKIYRIKKQERTDDFRKSKVFVLEAKEAVSLMLSLLKEGYTQKEERNAVLFEKDEEGTELTISWTISQATLPTAHEVAEQKAFAIM